MAVVETLLGTPVTEAANGFGMPVTKVVGRPGMPVVYETIGVAAPVVYATFDGVAQDVTLSGGNLIATHTNTNTGAGARSTSLRATRKYYFEVRINASHGNGDFMGIMSSTGTYANVTSGAAGPYAGVYRNTGSVVVGAAASGKNIGAVVAGSFVGFAVDLDARLLWVRRDATNWNGDVAANPATGANGVTLTAAISYAPVVTFGAAGTVANDAFTANFGATAYTNSVPSGFGNWGT
jgi:hypothetical protein